MPPRNPTLPGIDNPNGSPQDPNVVRPTNVARLPTNSGRQSSNIGRRPPNAFQSPQFVSPPQRMIVPQQVADLQTQLNQAKQQIQTLQQIQTNVTHPPSQRSIQDKQTIEIKAQIREIVKTKIWNVVKFVVKDKEAMMIKAMCYDLYVEKYTETTITEQEFVYYYFSYIMNELNKLRMYVSGRAYFKGFKGIPMDMETPDVDLLEQCLKRTLNSKNEEDLQVFNWYMDKYLPYTTGLAVTFGPTVRHYSTISEALDPNDPNEKAITIETEAFAVLIYENNLTKWTYYHEDLDNTYAKKYKYMPCNRKPTGDPVKDALVLEYEVDETDGASILRIYSPKARGKYTQSDCGQSRYGGWNRQGMVRYNQLCELAVQGRQNANCTVLERASLDAVRQKYGKKANSHYEERLQRRKRDAPAPVDDDFTTLRLPIRNRLRTARLPAITNGGSSNGNTARLPPITYGNLTSPTAPSQQGHSGSEKMPALGDNTMASFANLDDTGLEDNDDVDYDEHYEEEEV